MPAATAPPWDTGWKRCLGATDPMPAMTRCNPRSPEVAAPSAYQVGPKHLLCDQSTVVGQLTTGQLRRHIQGLLPRHLRPAWEWLASERTIGSPAEVEPLAAWIATEGATHGVRTPNAQERARAMGIDDYMHSLGLSDIDSYNATGNAFDGSALLSRIEEPLKKLGSAPAPNPDRWLPADAVDDIWRAAVAERRHAGADPDGLRSPPAARPPLYTTACGAART